LPYNCRKHSQTTSTVLFEVKWLERPTAGNNSQAVYWVTTVELILK
jgi:hypothetical protein